MGRKGICDVEADGLNPTRLHCIGFLDIDTGERIGFKPNELHLFKEFDKEVDMYIGHHFLTYDAPALNKFCGTSIGVERITDTLILSRLFFTLRNKHSLESWGEELGLPKLEFTDFSEFTEEMYTYMMRDLDVNLAVWKHFQPCFKEFSSFSIRLEHDIQDFLNEQQRNGFPLKVDKVYSLLEEIKTKKATVLERIKVDFPPMRKLVEVYSPKPTKSGELTIASMRKIKRFDDEGLADYVGNNTYKLYQRVEFNINSPSQIVTRMNEWGWKPVEFTENGNPKVSEANLNTLPSTAPESAKLIGECKMLENREAVLLGWLDAYNPTTGCIHGTTIGLGAVTHRMAHRNPQMANIPAVRSEYGEEFRSCLGVADTENEVQVGVDISGIQVRILAHYMNDPEYTYAVCHGNSKDGTDVHTVNMRILQEVCPWVDRDAAKKFLYSMLLGASGFKLGMDMGAGEAEGSRAKTLLFSRIPAFKRVDKMCDVAAKRGYMVGLDGRRAPIKSKHFALSVYLQNGEAVIMKQAAVTARRTITEFPWWSMAIVHDEMQTRTHKTYGTELGVRLVKCIENAGEFFELRAPVTGEYKIGSNWAQCH